MRHKVVLQPAIPDEELQIEQGPNVPITHAAELRLIRRNRDGSSFREGVNPPPTLSDTFGIHVPRAGKVQTQRAESRSSSRKRDDAASKPGIPAICETSLTAAGKSQLSNHGYSAANPGCEF
jgi:hypothetical protein